ncbi:MAG: hypothetical protein F4233_15030, partial [Rhodospirillaceae bacterium]|nr:hypothetical protein [Rhodospirillaceae bacterium]
MRKHASDVGVGQRGLVLVRTELGVEDELGNAVERDREAAPGVVDVDVHPAGRPGHRRLDRVAAQMDGVHAPAGKVALHPGLAFVAHAEMLAHQAARAVAADEVAGGSLESLAVMLDRRRGPFAVVMHGNDLVFVMQSDRGLGGGVALQHPLDIHLGDPVRQLGGAPRAGELFRQFGGLARRRQAEARQLVAPIGRVVDDIGRMVGRQAEPADLTGKAEPPEMLHGARLGGVGLGAEGIRPVVVEQRDGNAAPAEFDGEHQPRRPAAGDDDVRIGQARSGSGFVQGTGSLPAGFRGYCLSDLTAGSGCETIPRWSPEGMSMICQTRTTLLLIVGGLSAGLAALAAPPASGATDCAGFIQPLGRAGSFWRQAGAERIQACIAQLGTAARSKRRQLTPLHLAALFNGNPAVHSALLNTGADPNAKAKGGFAPLHLAAQSGRSPAVVATLLDAGADPDARTDKGFTPLHLAVENNRTPEVVVALLQGGADPDTRNKQGATPLILAVRYDRNPTIVAALLQGGADPNLRTEKGFSPLHLAAQYSRQTGIVAELLKGGADPNSWIRGGFTPLHIAAQHNRNPAIAAELLKGGARPDARTGKGASPLHLAAMFSRNPAVVATLIKGGADPNAKIKAGATPLHLAAYRNGNPAIVTA